MERFQSARTGWRDKPAATAAIICALLVSITAGGQSGPQAAAAPRVALSESEIIGQADARIEKYRKGDAVLRLIAPDGRPVPAGRTVRVEQTRHRFLFGANIFMLGRCRTPADNAAYAARFADLLNYATVPFYWWAYEPQPGEPRYADTDRILDWTRQHQVTVKGHPLAWNFQDPAWLPDDLALVRQLQTDRVEQIVRRFRDRIDIFDVVNEATHFDRPETRRQAPKLTAAIAEEGVPAYLIRSFGSAQASNPKATLVINDYETGDAYARDVLSKLVDLRGQPAYDVVGIQAHQHRGAWPATKIWEVCERFAVFGKPLHFTETTFLSGEQGWELKQKDPAFQWTSTPEGERRQAEDAARFYTILFSHPSVQAITWWDFSDQGAWQGAPAGLLRDDMTPKPAYEALKSLIKDKWWTRATVQTGAKGEARLRGFYGDYAVTVEEGGRTLRGTFSLDPASRGTREVRLQ